MWGDGAGGSGGWGRAVSFSKWWVRWASGVDGVWEGWRCWGDGC